MAEERRTSWAEAFRAFATSDFMLYTGIGLMMFLMGVGMRTCGESAADVKVEAFRACMATAQDPAACSKLLP